MSGGTGKVAIVTGANCGLGFEVARYLCGDGYEVILACRSVEKGQQAVERILKDKTDAKASFMKLDLSDMCSVKLFVNEFHASARRLDVLVNNAGLFLNMKGTTPQLSKDNFELTMATNHLGHFLLTDSLLDDLKRAGGETGDARIVVVASSLHDATTTTRMQVEPLNMENLMLTAPGSYTGNQAYKNSKLANVLFTYELSRRLDGSGLTVNCLCPGFIPSTELVRSAGAFTRVMIRYVLTPIFRLKNVTRTLEQGSRAIYDLASSDSLKGVTGKYFQDGQESKSSNESYNEEMQRELWDLSSRYCQLDGYDPIIVTGQESDLHILDTKE